MFRATPAVPTATLPSANVFAGPGETLTVCDPVALEAASVAVTVCDPLVLSVTTKEWTPLSVFVNVYCAGCSTAWPSREVRTTVPR